MTAFPPWTEEHERFRDAVREFAEREMAPFRKEWDDQGSFPRELFHKLADLGVLGIRFSEEHGGLGLDWWYTAAFVEGLSHCRNAGVVMSILVDTDMATPIIHEIGTPEQKQEFLAPVIAGEKVAALGVTEPGCGSDVAAIRTTARSDGDDYIIDGQKTFITNGAFADFITLAVRTGPEGHAGISLVLFPTDTPGFTVGRKLDKLGTRSVDSCELHFEGCRIPKRYLLGQENAGFYYIMTNFQGERLVGAMMANCAMQLALDDAMKYGKERHAFGRPIGTFQVWRHKFAEHLTALEASRALTWQAVQRIQTGQDPTRLVSMAKLYASDLAQDVIYDCLQFHGGYGFIEEYDVCRSFRDVRLIPIGGGSSEVMKEIIWKWESMGG